MKASRRALVACFAVLGLTEYALMLLPGEIEIGAPRWGAIALWAIALWFLARGSLVAWLLVFLGATWLALSLAFMGVGFGLESALLIVLVALQFLILCAPAIRPRLSDRPGDPQGAY